MRALKTAEAAKPEAVKEAITPAAMNALLRELYLNAKKKKALDIKKSCREIESYRWPADRQQTVDAILSAAQGYQFDKICREIESMIPDITSTL